MNAMSTLPVTAAAPEAPTSATVKTDSADGDAFAGLLSLVLGTGSAPQAMGGDGTGAHHGGAHADGADRPGGHADCAGLDLSATALLLAAAAALGVAGAAGAQPRGNPAAGTATGADGTALSVSLEAGAHVHSAASAPGGPVLPLGRPDPAPAAEGLENPLAQQPPGSAIATAAHADPADVPALARASRPGPDGGHGPTPPIAQAAAGALIGATASTAGPSPAGFVPLTAQAAAGLSGAAGVASAAARSAQPGPAADASRPDVSRPDAGRRDAGRPDNAAPDAGTAGLSGTFSVTPAQAAQPNAPLAAPLAPAAAPPPAAVLPQPELAQALASLRSRPNGTHELSVQLHPAELGAVQVTATISNGQLNVVLACAHQSARDAVTAALPALQQQLQADFGGVDLGWGGSTQQHDQPERQDRPAGPPARSDPITLDPSPAAATAAPRRVLSDAGLDRLL